MNSTVNKRIAATTTQRIGQLLMDVVSPSRNTENTAAESNIGSIDGEELNRMQLRDGKQIDTTPNTIYANLSGTEEDLFAQSMLPMPSSPLDHLTPTPKNPTRRNRPIIQPTMTKTATSNNNEWTFMDALVAALSRTNATGVSEKYEFVIVSLLTLFKFLIIAPVRLLWTLIWTPLSTWLQKLIVISGLDAWKVKWSSVLLIGVLALFWAITPSSPEDLLQSSPTPIISGSSSLNAKEWKVQSTHLNQRVDKLENLLSKLIQTADSIASTSSSTVSNTNSVHSDTSLNMYTMDSDFERVEDQLNSTIAQVEAIHNQLNQHSQLLNTIISETSATDGISAMDGNVGEWKEEVQMLKSALERISNSLESVTARIDNSFFNNADTDASTAGRILNDAGEKLQKPNYATRAAGARIIRYGGLTSRTYIDSPDVQKSSSHSTAQTSSTSTLGGGTIVTRWIYSLVPEWINRHISTLKRRRHYQSGTGNVFSPEVILHAPPTTSFESDSWLEFGQCWSFSSPSTKSNKDERHIRKSRGRGLVTILLGRPMRSLAYLTMRNPRADLWPSDVAPKSVEVWTGRITKPEWRDLRRGDAGGETKSMSAGLGLGRNGEFVKSVQSAFRRAMTATSTSTPSGTGDSKGGELGIVVEKVASAELDWASSSSSLAFITHRIPIDYPKADDEPDGADGVDIVQIRVLENMGGGDVTCLYPIGVHGDLLM